MLKQYILSALFVTIALASCTDSKTSTQDPNAVVKSVNRTKPQYPKSLALAGVSGWVEVLFDITFYGSVTNVRVIDSSHKGFEASAVTAISKWTYDVEDNKSVDNLKDRRTRLDYKLNK